MIVEIDGKLRIISMIVLIDGKPVTVENDVRILYENQPFSVDNNGKESKCDVHVIFNCEGMIIDVWDNEKDNELLDTKCRTIDDLIEM